MLRLLRKNRLRDKSARGAVILSIATVYERVIRLVRNMILARLLSPNDFGLMGIIMAILITVEESTDIGIQQVLIQNRNADKQAFMNITWWIQTVRGTALFLIAQMISPWICRFYEKPELLVPLRFILMVIFFSGFVSPRLYRLEKEFKYIRSAILFQGITSIGNIVSIILGLYFQNVWVLIIGRAAEGLIRLVMSYILCPFFPNFKFDRGYAKSIISFSRGMIGLPVLAVISMHGDIFVLGKLVTTELVGLYVLATALAQQASALFGRVVNRILFAAFSHKQDDKKKIRFALRTILRNEIIVGIPFLIFVGYYSEPILRVIYGAQYVAISRVFIILCWMVFIRIQVNILALVYLAIGKPHLHRRLMALLALILCGLIYPGIKWLGLLGAASVMLISNIVTCVFQVYLLRREIGMTFDEYIAIWKPAMVLLPLSILLYHIFSYSGLDHDIVQLGIGTILGGVIIGFYYLVQVMRTTCTE